MSILGDLIGVLIQTLSIYTLVLFVRVLLSWFPNLDWSNPVLSTVSAITDPYLGVFRGLIPPPGRPGPLSDRGFPGPAVTARIAGAEPGLLLSSFLLSRIRVGDGLLQGQQVIKLTRAGSNRSAEAAGLHVGEAERAWGARWDSQTQGEA